MASLPAIAVRDLHEVFRVYTERPPGLKERLYRFRRARFHEFHALDGVTFTVDHGESVALIGHNGSGKSTLLKCLARILPADEGTVRVDGRVATLLELGAGFHQDLSGRDNIYLNGAILGLSRREIDAAFDDIVEFAGVREFIDVPVRNYSSGMYVRLGFAIAVHVNPDILLIDEVLSVGDASFQSKSLERMRSFIDTGKTVVLVSHDLAAVRSLCRRTIVLDHGKIVFDGSTDDGLSVYEQIMATGSVPLPAAREQREGRSGDGRLRITEAKFAVPGHTAGTPVPTGARARLELEVTARDDVTADGSIGIGVAVRRPDVVPLVYETRTAWRAQYVAPPPVGRSMRATFELELNLLTGTYLFDLLVINATSGAVHDRWLGAVEQVVHSAASEQGVAPLDARIRIHNPDGVWPPENLPPPLEEGGPVYHPLRDGPAGAGPEQDTSEAAGEQRRA